MNCMSCGRGPDTIWPDEKIHAWCGMPVTLTVEELASIARYGGSQTRSLFAYRNESFLEGDWDFVKTVATEMTLKGPTYTLRTSPMVSLEFAQKMTEWPIYRNAK